MDPKTYWSAFFILMIVIFVLIIQLTRDKRYICYFILGAAIGVYFDYFGTMIGIYSYSGLNKTLLFGRIPLSMPIAEGFAVAFTIFLYEKIVKRILRLSS